MDHMKCSSLPELTKVTKIDRVYEEMDTKLAENCAPSISSDSAKDEQIKRNTEPIPERMIRRTPHVSSFRDLVPSQHYHHGTRRHSDHVAKSFPFVPKPNSRVIGGPAKEIKIAKVTLIARFREKLTPHRIQRWSHSFMNLLGDHVGIQMFLAFLEKEFSAENLRFWLACQELKQTPRVKVPKLVAKIFSDFLDEQSPTATINVDSKTYNHVKLNLANPSYNTFDEAQEHIFQLMKTDSYPRFIRSDKYKQLVRDASGKSRKKMSTST